MRGPFDSVPPEAELALAVAASPTFDVLVGALLLGVGAVLAPVVMHLVELLVPERRVFFARWGFSHVLVLLFVLFFVGALINLFGPGAGALGGLYRMVVLLGCVGVTAGALAQRVEPGGWRALGLRAGGNGKALAAAAVVFLFLTPALYGAQLVWPHVIGWFGESWNEQRVLVGITSLDGAALAQAFLLAVVVLPFLEEVCFRGFLQPLLVQNLSDRGGVAATSALFALVHGIDAFLPVFVLSLAIGGIMLRTQRLAAAWFLHALNNGLTLSLALALGAQSPT